MSLRRTYACAARTPAPHVRLSPAVGLGRGMSLRRTHPAEPVRGSGP